MEEKIRKQLEVMNQQIKELASIYHSAASRYGISDNEFWVWYALLVLKGKCSQQDICDMWSLPKQTVNSVVMNLVKKEFVRLISLPGTRNRKMIHITDAGREYGEKIVTKICDAEQRSFERLSIEERHVCINLLGKYLGLLKEETYAL